MLVFGWANKMKTFTNKDQRQSADPSVMSTLPALIIFTQKLLHSFVFLARSLDGNFARVHQSLEKNNTFNFEYGHFLSLPKYK